MFCFFIIRLKLQFGYPIVPEALYLNDEIIIPLAVKRPLCEIQVSIILKPVKTGPVRMDAVLFFRVTFSVLSPDDVIIPILGVTPAILLDGTIRISSVPKFHFLAKVLKICLDKLYAVLIRAGEIASVTKPDKIGFERHFSAII